MLGAFAVGKTSLVTRFVRSVFDEKYHTTIGVKIDKKAVDLGEQSVNLVLWDLAGEDRFRQVQTAYLKGAAGYMLVVDRTREETLDVALEIRARVESEFGSMPFVLLVNKSDLVEESAIDAARLDEVRSQGWLVVETSAKSGDGVEQAFSDLAALTVA